MISTFALSAALCTFMLSAGVVHGADSHSQSGTLKDYVPPPMFADPVDGPLSRPIDVTPEMLNRPAIVKPSVRKLLGYKDTAYEAARINNLPVPPRKPENIEQIVKLSQLAQTSSSAVPERDNMVDPEPAMREEDNLQVSGNEMTGNKNEQESTKILNARGIDIMRDDERKALVDLVFAGPSSMTSTQNPKADILSEPSLDTKKPDKPDPRSLASLVGNKAKIKEQYVRSDNENQINSPVDDKRQNESSSTRKVEKAEMEKQAEPRETQMANNVLRPPQDILDDVDASKARIQPSSSKSSPSPSPAAPSPPSSSDDILVTTRVIDAEIAKRLAQKEPAAASHTPPVNNKDVAVDVSVGKSLENISLNFIEGQTELTEDHKGNIQNTLIRELRNNPDIRLEIKAFANQIDDNQSGARRISLARALSVREFLISKGIDADRMDLRALGDQNPQGEDNRVDINLKSL